MGIAQHEEVRIDIWFGIDGMDIYRRVGKVRKSGCEMNYIVNKHTQLP